MQSNVTILVHVLQVESLDHGFLSEKQRFLVYHALRWKKSKFLPLFLFGTGLCCLRKETDRAESKSFYKSSFNQVINLADISGLLSASYSLHQHKYMY